MANFTNLLSEKRLRHDGKGFYLEADNIDSSRHYRSAFHRDYDRIVFSNPFRRLSKKTQVHPLSKNDHVHNRLTHSLETASVGRSLGLITGSKNAVELKHDLASVIQAACLAHDIGNPPFGHAGEDVIKSWFLNPDNSKYLCSLTHEEQCDFTKFDGNAQSFRIVTQLEHNLFRGGMQLSISTVASMVKYPWFAHETNKDKFNFFITEKKIAKIIFSELGLFKDGKFVRYPLSYLMEVSDDICYALLDLQDAVELGIIRTEDTHHIFQKLCTEQEFDKCKNDKSLSRLCAFSVNNLAVHAGDVFTNNLERIFSGNDMANDLLGLFEDKNLVEGLGAAKSFARDNIFNDKRKIELELGAYNVIGTLLDNLIFAAYELHTDKDNLSYRSKRIMQMMEENAPQADESLHEKYHRVIDYIVGMTDNYAIHKAHQLSGMAY